MESSEDMVMTDGPANPVSFIDTIGRIWCRLMHDALMWPMHGEYECRICMRRFPVAWGEAPKKTVSTVKPVAVLSRQFIPVCRPMQIHEAQRVLAVRAGSTGALRSAGSLHDAA